MTFVNTKDIKKKSKSSNYFYVNFKLFTLASLMFHFISMEFKFSFLIPENTNTCTENCMIFLHKIKLSTNKSLTTTPPGNFN